MYKKGFFGLSCVPIFLLAMGWGVVWGADWPKNISIGTGPAGGTNYISGGAFVRILEKMGVKGIVEVTGGSVHNPKLMQAKQIQFCTIMSSSAWQAYNGEGWAKQKYDSFRSLVTLFPGYGQGYTLRKKNIRDFRGFDGKVVSGGPAGGGSDLYLREIGAVLGVKFSRVVTVPFAETVALLQDGLIDVGWTAGGAPLGPANEVTSTMDGVIVGFTHEDINKIQAKFPFFSAGELPANVYKNQPSPIPTFTDWSVLFAHKDLPDDMIYRFMELIFANQSLLVAAHIGLKDVILQNQKYLRLPLHPGAYKYYKEKGIPLSPEALPPK